MKYIFLFIPLFLFAVDYSTLYSERGKGFDDSHVTIKGKFNSYWCNKSGRSIDNYCNVALSVYDGEKYLNRVVLQVGTTYESDLKDSTRNDYLSFGCTYKGSLFNFKDCN